MTAPALRPTGQAAVQVELLTRLGLPASASPEDIDDLHQAVSEYLAAAPSDIRGWARAQVAALDTAYLQLTDPVGLEGSTLRSPASPPEVEPGGPATPPARRDPVPAPVVAELPATADEDTLEIDGEPTADDLAAMYAMVTPSVHDDMKPRPAAAKAAPAAGPATGRKAVPQAATAATATTAAAPAAPSNAWKAVALGLASVGIAVVVLVGGFAAINGGLGSPAPSAVAEASAPAAPSVDLAKIGALMETLNAKPGDVETLLALGDEYYNGGEFETAAGWFDRILASDPDHIQALLARGAVDFNLGDKVQAETRWTRVLALDPKNVEALYDLGFMAFYQATPDYGKVQDYWAQVVALDPDSDLGKQVQTHLDALAAKSLIPEPSGAPAGSPAASPAASPATSPVASPAASPAASARP